MVEAAAGGAGGLVKSDYCPTCYAGAGVAYRTMYGYYSRGWSARCVWCGVVTDYHPLRRSILSVPGP